MFNFSDTIILFDTEYTAWEGSQERRWSGEGEHRELLQIAAIKVDTKSLTEIESFSILVQPKINPKLSEYIIHLTGITQADIDENGVRFAEALQKYREWTGALDTYSFGGDEKIFKENCELTGIPFSFTNQFFDIRCTFQKHGIPAEKYQSGNIVEAFGEKKTRNQHDALNDARTILDGLRLLAQHIEKQKTA